MTSKRKRDKFGRITNNNNLPEPNRDPKTGRYIPVKTIKGFKHV